MATLNTYFRDFLQSIRPTKNQKEDMQTGHVTLRERLASYESLKDIVVSDFLQGSYRRSTAIRPKGESRSDVDIVVVTNLNEEEYSNPKEALELFRPFVKEYYKGKYKFQGRSIGIEMSYVDLDLVITSAPSEADQKALSWSAVRSCDTPEDVNNWFFNEYWVPSNERQALGAVSRLNKAADTPQWKSEPLRIPDRDAGLWVPTHPLEQISWTFAKSKATNRHYVNVVKAIKWWQRVHHSTQRPRGYPLEHIIGDCCPDGIGSVAEGVTLTLEAICNHSGESADRGVDQDVLGRISDDDFSQFQTQVTTAAEQARRALDEEDTAESAHLWRELFGDKFPKGGYTKRNSASSTLPRGRFG
jgi:hypothetical protein